MGDTHDHDWGRSEREQGRGARFDQQGQHVHGPQYNADRINISESVSPDAIAEGMQRFHEGPPPKGESRADFERRWEQNELKSYGYRYYTRDRRRWLQTLSPQERREEEQRRRKRLGTESAYHRRVLRAGKLAPDTSPADPQYVRAKRKLDLRSAQRRRYATIALIVCCLALMLFAKATGATWLFILIGLPATLIAPFWILDTWVQRKKGPRQSHP
ncbi:hypothetical protein GCM10027447_37040 [Glycomyces halotolerans]